MTSRLVDGNRFRVGSGSSRQSRSPMKGEGASRELLRRDCAKRSGARDSCNSEWAQTRSTDSFDTEGKELTPVEITLSAWPQAKRRTNGRLGGCPRACDDRDINLNLEYDRGIGGGGGAKRIREGARCSHGRIFDASSVLVRYFALPARRPEVPWPRHGVHQWCCFRRNRACGW